MLGGLAVGLLARPWARRAAGYAVVALTVTLFILNLRRAAERVGRATERLETLERTDAVNRLAKLTPYRHPKLTPPLDIEIRA